MIQHPDDTIVAMITPPGIGGVSTLRLSGDQARSIAARCLAAFDPLTAAPNTLRHARFIDAAGHTIDDIVASVFHAPHSFTGEDVVEISCHGNPILVNMLLQTIVGCGARLAEPGEFTRRSFLNGKIDLTQAEAVADLVAASSARAVELSRRQLQGELRSYIRAILDDLVKLCGEIELELDFVEEGIKLHSEESILHAIAKASESIDRLMATFKTGRLYAHGVDVAIVGKPNAGKSSLLNRLAGEERVIVSPDPGTTRDTVDVALEIDGILVRFWDTAGLRSDAEGIEQLGIVRTRNRMDKADIVLFVLDSSQEPDLLAVQEIFQDIGGKPRILVCNKSDLQLDPKVGALLPKFQPSIAVSALTGQGIEDLVASIAANVRHDLSSVGDSEVITSQRHFDRLEAARASLTEASCIAGMSGEFLSIPLRKAITCLGEITGEVTSDDILREIFDHFCIGK